MLALSCLVAGVLIGVVLSYLWLFRTRKPAQPVTNFWHELGPRNLVGITLSRMQEITQGDRAHLWEDLYQILQEIESSKQALKAVVARELEAAKTQGFPGISKE